MIQYDFGYHRYPSWSNIASFIRQFQRYAEGEKKLLEKIPTYYSYLDKTKEISSDR